MCFQRTWHAKIAWSFRPCCCDIYDSCAMGHRDWNSKRSSAICRREITYISRELGKPS